MAQTQLADVIVPSEFTAFRRALFRQPFRFLA